MNCFDEVKKNFGFGCMRLQMNGDEVDYDEFKKMIDAFLENGFNYFDTAHGYISGKSETSLRDCLVKRYPRERFILTNKLSENYFTKNEDIRPLFESQLEACGVEYFDFYLMHAQNRKNFVQYKDCRAYETAFELKKEGKVKHVGISFHDTADVLDMILTEYPELEVVQLQFNYLDYEDDNIQSRKCYEVCVKHNKPVMVMEPVKGGRLVNLPDAAKAIFERCGSGSTASYAIRFAASFENVKMVLSGMGNMDMMLDNISYMKDFKPLTDEEKTAVAKVSAILRSENAIECTACRYCTAGCPKNIAIPDLFYCMNGKNAWKNWDADAHYGVHTENGGRAGDCIGCGKCEKICPQHLPIRELLKKVSKEFDK